MKSNNFRDLLTVTKFTMRDMLGRKSFRISTIIIVVLIVLGFNVPNFINSINGGDFSDTMILSDPENLYNGALDSLNQAEDSLGYKFDISSLNADEIKAKVNDGEVSSAIIINRGTENNINLNYIVKNSATAFWIPSTASTLIFKSKNSIYQPNNLPKFLPSSKLISNKPKIKKSAATSLS